MTGYLATPLPERFWPKVEVRGHDDCWPWATGRTEAGYGRFSVARSTPARAHRVAYELTKGHIPAGMIVMHTCDNPPCCNPSHLVLGTQAENLADMRAKGRGVNPPMPVLEGVS